MISSSALRAVRSGEQLIQTVPPMAPDDAETLANTDAADAAERLHAARDNLVEFCRAASVPPART